VRGARGFGEAFEFLRESRDDLPHQRLLLLHAVRGFFGGTSR
jgi:hypothetical protein